MARLHVAIVTPMPAVAEDRAYHRFTSPHATHGSDDAAGLEGDHEHHRCGERRVQRAERPTSGLAHQPGHGGLGDRLALVQQLIHEALAVVEHHEADVLVRGEVHRARHVGRRTGVADDARLPDGPVDPAHCVLSPPGLDRSGMQVLDCLAREQPRTIEGAAGKVGCQEATEVVGAGHQPAGGHQVRPPQRIAAGRNPEPEAVRIGQAVRGGPVDVNVRVVHAREA